MFTGKLLNMMDISYYLHRLVFVSACIWHIAKLRIIFETLTIEGIVKTAGMLLGYMERMGGI